MSWTAFSALPLLERNLWVEKHERESGRCKCGNDRHVCSDDSRDWFPQRTVCYAEMETLAANRRYDEIHEDKPWHDGTFQKWSAEPSKQAPYNFRDGVTVWVAPVDLSPDDTFLTDRRAPGTSRGGEHGNEA